jgi:hypothetical protein
MMWVFKLFDEQNLSYSLESAHKMFLTSLYVSTYTQTKVQGNTFSTPFYSALKCPQQHAQENASIVPHSANALPHRALMSYQGPEERPYFLGWICPSTVLGIHSKNKPMSLERTVCIILGLISSKFCELFSK